MGDANYLPLIEDMVWSYSRIESFSSCPYKFFLKYISKCSESDRLFSTYGSFMHEIIEEYYNGKLSREEMLIKYLTEFSSRVIGDRPSTEIAAKYFKCGIDYIENFQPFQFDTVAVEKRVDFKVGGLDFVGYIDYIGIKDGRYYIVDHKSRDLKPRSNRKTPTLKDKELDSMLRQLYIYSSALKQEYGEYPSALCFNCFRTGTFIQEPFREDAYFDAIQWANSEVNRIKMADEFYPCMDFFACKYLCGVSDDCVYHQTMYSERRVR